MSKAVVVVLTAEEFGSLASAAAATARNNLKAADRLLAGGFWPQARALAVLAYEEAGKSWLCTTAMLSPDDMREQLPVGELNWHVSKLTSARTLTAFLSLLRTENATLPLAADLLAELTELAGEDETSKERCLYTDY